ncbi:hypothetical protein [Thalassospira sp.]|uniref:hypothetical protein n=1 Tax=Thalassospira sp. TaxID=1912094 RepID=UPI0027330883|nr:hypothetical protein [Thalassospira sp.]MDP2698303.1 hypothetical protein [Thalassospira sp.]
MTDIFHLFCKHCLRALSDRRGLSICLMLALVLSGMSHFAPPLGQTTSATHHATMSHHQHHTSSPDNSTADPLAVNHHGHGICGLCVPVMPLITAQIGIINPTWRHPGNHIARAFTPSLPQQPPQTV